LARILDVTPGGIVQVAPTGAILRANRQAQDFLGLSWDELASTYVADFGGDTYRDDNTPCTVEEYPVSRCLATGEAQEPMTIGVRQPNKEIRWAIFTALPFIAEPDERPGAIVTFVEITDRKRAELRTRAERQLLDAVRLVHSRDQQNAPATAIREPLAALLELTQSGLAFVASPVDAARRELIVHALVDESGPRGPGSVPNTAPDPLSVEALGNGSAVVRERPGPLGGPFGGRAPETAAVIPLRAGDEVVGLLGLADAPTVYEPSILEYIHPVLAGFADLVSAIDERRAKQSLEAQLAQAERLASVGTLAAGMAHEINNPLAYVLLNLEAATRHAEQITTGLAGLADDLAARLGEEEAEVLLARHEPFARRDAEEVARYARDATDGAERVRRIVRDLMTFSRVTEDRKGLVDIHSALEAALKMAQHEIKYRARLVRELEPVAPVLGHDGRISQVFLNLVINAARAIEEGSPESNEIRVRTRMVDDEVQITVEDTGQGVAKEHLPRLFEPFFTTRSPGAGAGLGLSICHNLVRAHGGRIDVESEKGEGSRFVVTFPAATRRPERSAVPEVVSRAPITQETRRRVLLVDDEPMVSRVLAQLLRRRYDVETASGLETAIAALGEGRELDVVLCDMMMLDGTGVDVHVWVEANRPELARRMIFMTGGTFTPKARSFLANIESPSLTKPFALAEVDAAIAKVLADAPD
jgi:signal transduction histidine kinase/CheY-like chemotaxis protein